MHMESSAGQSLCCPWEQFNWRIKLHRLCVAEGLLQVWLLAGTKQKAESCRSPVVQTVLLQHEMKITKEENVIFTG